MPLEVEVRFRIPAPRTRDKILEDPGVTALMMRDFRATEMSAEYYDSPTHALKTLRSTLRRRLEDGKPHVSFKTASSDDGNLLARQKWQCSADEISVAIGILMDMGAPEFLGEHARSEGYIARGRFWYTRRGAPLMLPPAETSDDRTAIELAVDEGELNTDGKHEPMLEVVLKLLYGDPAALVAFAEALEKKHGLTRELCSKYERVLRLLRSRR
ncbi:hypothetical protein FACS18949_03660 [Clostridia bacterium]|nr:hypothetical protein FACS18949_03660 [Clostridia bacterium]